MSPGRAGAKQMPQGEAWVFSFVLSANNAEQSLSWTWNDANPTSFGLYSSPDGVTNWEFVFSVPGDTRTITELEPNYYRLQVSGGSHDHLLSNVVHLQDV